MYLLQEAWTPRWIALKGLNMNDESFKLLMEIISILRKHEDNNIVESTIEIIEACDKTLTTEQKIMILKELLHMHGVSQAEEAHDKIFETESKEIENVDDRYN